MAKFDDFDLDVTKTAAQGGSLVDGDLEILSQSHPTIIRVHLKEGGKA